MLNNAKGLLTAAAGIVTRVLDEEEDSLDNMPENLQGSEQYEKKEAIIEMLNEASDSIDTAIEKVSEAVI